MRGVNLQWSLKTPRQQPGWLSQTSGNPLDQLPGRAGEPICRIGHYVALERRTIPFPAGFEPERHAKALPAAMAKKGHGEGWRVESIDPDRKIVSVVREKSVTEVTEDAGQPSAKRVSLPGGTKPSDSDKVATLDAHVLTHVPQGLSHD